MIQFWIFIRYVQCLSEIKLKYHPDKIRRVKAPATGIIRWITSSIYVITSNHIVFGSEIFVIYIFNSRMFNDNSWISLDEPHTLTHTNWFQSNHATKNRMKKYTHTQRYSDTFLSWDSVDAESKNAKSNNNNINPRGYKFTKQKKINKTTKNISKMY